MIVAIEGLDGVGKTTVAGMLRSSLTGCVQLHTPPRSYYDGNLEVLRDLASPARAVLFTAGVLATNERLHQHDGSIAVIDRFTGSIAGMNGYLQPSLKSVCHDLSLVCADLTIELTCEEDVRDLRLRRRGKPLDPFELLLKGDGKLRTALGDSIEACAALHVRIDTTNLTTGLVARLCLHLLERHLPVPRGFGVMDKTAVASLVDDLSDAGMSDDALRCYFGRSERKIDHNWLQSGSEDASEALDQLAVSISAAGSVAPVAIGGERSDAWKSPHDDRSASVTAREVVRQAKAELARVLMERAPDLPAAEDLQVALGTLESAVLDATNVDATDLNQALVTLQPFFHSQDGRATYARLAQVVAQLV